MSRNYGTNIVVDGSWFNSPEADDVPASKLPRDPVGTYENQVMDMLRSLDQRSKVGNLVLRAIAGCGRRLRIIPHHPGDDLAASAHAADWNKASAPSGKKCIPGKCVTGGGSDVVIWFEPSTQSSKFYYAAYDPGHFSRAEDTLLHELFHALRLMRGIFTWDKMGFNYDLVEEFYSILITNIYMAETGRAAGIRGDHRVEHNTLATRDQQGLWREKDMIHYMNFKTQIDDLCEEMPDVSNPIAQLTVAWNPIRRRYWNERLKGVW